MTLAERGACDCVDERGACDRPTCATVQSGAMHLNANCVQLEVKEARLDPTSRFWSFLALALRPCDPHMYPPLVFVNEQTHFKAM